MQIHREFFVTMNEAIQYIEYIEETEAHENDEYVQIKSELTSIYQISTRIKIEDEDIRVFN
jgi:hypothetical protein